MKLYKFDTDNETFYVYAESRQAAEVLLIREHFPAVLDDELADLYEVEEVVDETIIQAYATETFKEKYERIRNK